MIKNKIDNKAYIYLYNNNYFYKSQLIQNISEYSCIPYNTIVNVYIYSKIYVDEYKNYTEAFNWENKRYSYKGFSNIYYVYVDLYKDTVFWNINNSRKKKKAIKKIRKQS
jgi:hypothetical protein